MILKPAHTNFGGRPPVSSDAREDLVVRGTSVRWCTSQPVARSIVVEVILVAAEAPSERNRQPSSIRIFDDPDMVQRVATIPMGTAGYAKGPPTIAFIFSGPPAFIDEPDRPLIDIDRC